MYSISTWINAKNSSKKSSWIKNSPQLNILSKIWDSAHDGMLNMCKNATYVIFLMILTLKIHTNIDYEQHVIK